MGRGRGIVWVPVVAALGIAWPAIAELTVETLRAKDRNGAEFAFPIVAGDSTAASQINTFLHAIELQKLPGRFRDSPFEEVWTSPESPNGMVHLAYSVEANEPSFLALSIVGEYYGASLNVVGRVYNFDARTGGPIALQTLFDEKGLVQLRERVAKQRLQQLDDFVAGKTVQGDVQLRSDPEIAEEQKTLYRECRPRIAKSNLSYDDLILREDGLYLRREPCAPRVQVAIDDLVFSNTLSYASLRDTFNAYGRCLLVERRSDCKREGGAIAAGVYRGSLGGRYPITLVIEGVGANGSGSAMYFYDKYATAIRLSARRSDDGRVQLAERGPPPARFDLGATGGALEGSWTQEGKPPLEIQLH